MGIFHTLLCCWTVVASQGAATSEAQLIEPMPMAELVSILKEIGYQPALDRYGRLSQLTKVGRSVDTSASTTGSGTGNEKVVGINLYRRYSTHRTLDGSHVYDWLTSAAKEANILVVQQLDRSVWVDGTVVLGHGLTKTRLRYELDSLWGSYASIEEELLGPGWRALDPAELGALPPPPDPTVKVFHLSNHDIAYLIRSWNWTFKGSYLGLGPTVTTPAVIGGVTFWFCRPHPGYPVWDHLAVFTEFAMPKTDDLQGWIDKMNAKLSGPKLDGYPGGPNMLIVLDLDLAPGMTLAKLKTSIERFAKQAAPFVRGDFSKAPTRTNLLSGPEGLPPSDGPSSSAEIGGSRAATETDAATGYRPTCRPQRNGSPEAPEMGSGRPPAGSQNGNADESAGELKRG